MKTLITLLLLLSLSTSAFAIATNETKDKRAVPKIAYATTASGEIKPVRTNANGELILD